MAEFGLRRFHVATRAAACDRMRRWNHRDYLGLEICADSTPHSTEFRLLAFTATSCRHWKLYQENLKDPYHATLLHTYLTTFGLFTIQRSISPINSVGSGLLSRRSDGRPDVPEEDQASMQAFKKTMELNDPRVLAFFPRRIQSGRDQC